MTSGSEQIPDGWIREEIVAGMDTVGTLVDDGYLGMGGGYKCETCSHFIPIEAIEEACCPICDRQGMIGTVIMGRQEVTALYPEGWFDD